MSDERLAPPVASEPAISVALVEDEAGTRERLVHALGQASRLCLAHAAGTGQELLEGIKEFALNAFGPLAFTVFSEWGIHTTEDFGEIVFNLVDAGRLGKTESDSRDDFKQVYDFNDVFVKPYEPRATDPAPRSSARRRKREA